MTGGSDYHGQGSGRTAGLGRIGLGAEDYARLVERRIKAEGIRQKAEVSNELTPSSIFE